MAIRLADILVYGELRNTSPWFTHGYLLLDGLRTPVMMEITGNCDPDLHGKVFRFAPRSGGASMKEVLESITWEDPVLPEGLPYDPGDDPEGTAKAYADGLRDGARAKEAIGGSPTSPEAEAIGESASSPKSKAESALPTSSNGASATDAGAASGTSDIPPVEDLFSPGPPDPAFPKELPQNFGIHQIGVTGDMTASRWIRALPCSVEEYLKRCDLGEKPPTQWKPSLYLEWYGQNGRVVIELEDPIIEVEVAKDQWATLLPAKLKPEGDPDAPPSDADGNEMPTMPEIVVIRDGQAHRIDPEEPIEEQIPSGGDAAENPAADLQRHLDAQTREVERSLRGGAPSEDDDIAEMELMDDLMEGDTGVAPASLFSGRRTLPRPDDVTEAQAATLLSTLLMELALFGIAVHACEHSTARQLYRILVNDILFDGEVYRELRGTGWVTKYLASEHCPLCEAEADLRYGSLSDPKPQGPPEA